MRKVVFGVANSLDNFIARPDGSVDWLRWSNDVASYTAAFWKTIDTVVMGRRTYEAGVRAGMSHYAGVTNIVLSQTMTSASDPAVQIVATDAADFVRELKQQPGSGICIMGGGVLANALFRADLIDEVGVNVHPILLGDGIPLFHALPRQIELKLEEHVPFAHGCVLLRYSVVRR